MNPPVVPVRRKTAPPPAFTGALALATCVAVASATLLAGPAHAADPALTIAAIQGTTDVSPYDGQTVTVEGVVTADYTTGGYKGIVIQTAGTGGDVKTDGASDGIFVYLGNAPAAAQRGDLVSVTGTVSEYNRQTQISPAAGGVSLVTAQVGTPEPVPLPDTVQGADREAYESMLVAPTGQYRLASSHQLYNYGTLWLNAGADLNLKATETTRPGPDADAIAAANRANRILLDDGYSIQISNKDHPGDQPYFTKDTVVRNGDTVQFPAEGQILQFGFEDWRLQPVIPIDNTSDASHKPTFSADNPREDAPPAVGGDVKVASFNVLNYFTTLQSENAEARGAKTSELFQIQRSKIIAGISGLGADIVGLMEIENGVRFGDPADTAVADLVAGLNEKDGAGTWDFVRTPAALLDPAITDVITTAIIYKPAVATPVGQSVTVPVDETVWGNAREPIAQTFTVGGATLSVIVNHFKSKSPPQGSTGEPADGQGWFNEDRVAQAQSLLALADTVKQTSGSDDILLVGDFNSYGREDPLAVLSDAGWTDVTPTAGSAQYTYTFDGELGSLDHVLVSPSAKERLTGAGIWGINSPEWGDRAYSFAQAEAGTPFRSSDHDPVLVGLSTAARPVNITVATMNDFHGRIEADQKSAGIASIATAVKELRAENPNTVFASAGDNIGASTFTSFISEDMPTVDALNAAGLEVSSVGNHEFDQGWADLRDRVIPAADFAYLGANIVDRATGKPALAPTWVKEMQGVRIGFIGAVTEELPSLVSPDGIADIEVTNIVSAVNAAAADLKDGDPSNGEADVIILLVHEGASSPEAASFAPTTPMGRIVTGVTKDVAAIVSAHTHQQYNTVIDGRPVVQAGQYGEALGVMQLSVDPNTKKLLSITNDIRQLTANGKPIAAPDPAVQKIVDDAKAVADVKGKVSLGTISADFNRALQSDGKTENRGGESPLGNWVADVHQWATDADFALMNPGGLRADLKYASSGPDDPAGNVTYKEAAAVQPFANTVMTVKLTGAQVKSVLEEQWQPDGASRPFLKLGASKQLTYTYDPAAPRGQHITTILLNGKPIDPTATYTVAANGFLAAGGDNFTTFAQGASRADSGRVDLQSTVDWFTANKAAVLDVAQRAVGVNLTPPADASGYAPGESVTVALSSLAFSTNEPKPSSVDVSLGGVKLATATVDTTPVDTTDEVGRASVTITIPSGISGAQKLTIEAGATTLELPVTIAGAVENSPKVTVSSTSVVAGGQLTVKGTDFDAAETVALQLHSTPVTLGSATADDAGAFATTVTIPAATTAGVHHLVVLRADGTEISVELTITAAGGTGTKPGDGLATTGVETGPWPALAVGLLIAGVGMLALRRRVYAD